MNWYLLIVRKNYFVKPSHYVIIPAKVSRHACAGRHPACFNKSKNDITMIVILANVSYHKAMLTVGNNTITPTKEANHLVHRD